MMKIVPSVMETEIVLIIVSVEFRAIELADA